jgi:hypothetical protein
MPSFAGIREIVAQILASASHIAARTHAVRGHRRAQQPDPAAYRSIDAVPARSRSVDPALDSSEIDLQPIPEPAPFRRIESAGALGSGGASARPRRPLSDPEEDVLLRFNAGLRARFDIDTSGAAVSSPVFVADSPFTLDPAGAGSAPVAAAPASAPPMPESRVSAHRMRERPDVGSGSSPGGEGSTLPTAQPWRAWVDERKPGSICVTGSYRLPAGSSGCRVTLQEPITSMQQEQSWGAGSGASGVLVLERVLLPAPFDSVPAASSSERYVDLFYRKPLRRGAPQAGSRYTHVSIMPDGLLLPIQDESLI